MSVGSETHPFFIHVCIQQIEDLCVLGTLAYLQVRKRHSLCVRCVHNLVGEIVTLQYDTCRARSKNKGALRAPRRAPVPDLLRRREESGDDLEGCLGQVEFILRSERWSEDKRREEGGNSSFRGPRFGALRVIPHGWIICSLWKLVGGRYMLASEP